MRWCHHLQRAGQTPAPPQARVVPYIEGSPGTFFSLALRFVQSLTAALALVAMVSANDFFTVPAFSFLVAATAIQSVWSLALALVDIDILITQCSLANEHWSTSLLIVGDTAAAEPAWGPGEGGGGEGGAQAPPTPKNSIETMRRRREKEGGRKKGRGAGGKRRGTSPPRPRILPPPLITGVMTFCAASMASGVVLYLQYDIQTCATEHCTQFETAVTRIVISFTSLMPSIAVSWIRSCAGTTRRPTFQADRILLYSSSICFVVCGIALFIYADNASSGRIRVKAFSFTIFALIVQLAASAAELVGQFTGMYFGSETPVPDWPLLCMLVIVVEWLLAFGMMGFACASTGLLHFVINDVFVASVNLRAIAFCALSIAAGTLAALAASVSTHLAILRWLRRRAQQQ
ncbi:unnamed protein product [Urochloa decumbens]|uniref:CASP-like protein n=1 Tax=Urochloa decumbens TaxID=240449 RepID=A0ABC8V7H7_9POAL